MREFSGYSVCLLHGGGHRRVDRGPLLHHESVMRKDLKGIKIHQAGMI